MGWQYIIDGKFTIANYHNREFEWKSCQEDVPNNFLQAHADITNYRIKK